MKAEDHENYKEPNVTRSYNDIPYESETYGVQELVSGSHFLDPFVCLTPEQYEELVSAWNTLQNDNLKDKQRVKQLPDSVGWWIRWDTKECIHINKDEHGFYYDSEYEGGSDPEIGKWIKIEEPKE